MHLFALVVLGGCSDPGASTAPTGSQTIISTGEGTGAVYLLDDDREAVVRFDPVAGGMASTPLGGTPGRIARAGDTVWVTLPFDRAIAVFTRGLLGLHRTGTLETGAEPRGIVARADGERLYVALATGGEVQELDADGAVLRSWPVDGQPTWLALRPGGDGLYVGSAYGGLLTWIDLESGAAQAVDLVIPTVTREVGGELLQRRITGDPSVSADGSMLAVPVLLVDNSTQADPPAPGEVVQYYVTVSEGLTRFNPAVALVDLGADGAPDGPQAALMLLAGYDHDRNFVRSYPSSVTFAPDGTFAVATMESSNTAVALSTAASVRGGLATSAMIHIGTDAGPRGAAFDETGALSFDCFIARSVPGLPGEAFDGAWDYRSSRRQPGGAQLPDSPLDPEVIAGRALYHSAVDPTIAASNSGVSCSTCHPAGRNDGLSWALEDGDRQTPSLAGGIEATAPFTWASGVDSVAQEVRLTSRLRMGGIDLTSIQSEQVAAYVELVRPTDVRLAGSRDDAVDRGRAVFERADVACATCHGGELYTDNLDWPLFGLDRVNTPSLRGVAATAPYLHDGRARTLRDVLDLSIDGAMGDTSGLTEAELDDLVAYLESI